jgi:tetratricopeptide (TPR) repeat protein
MKNLTPIGSIALLLIAAGVTAQGATEDSAAVDAIAAEVFASDIVAPDQPQEDIQIDDEPTLDQVVPVADEADEVGEADEIGEADEEMVAKPSTNQPEDYSPPRQSTVLLPADATEEEQLLWYYAQYKELMDNAVYDEADTVAKQVVELAIKAKGPKSSDFARALTNLAIVQHHTRQYDAAQQNFQSAIEIIEDNEDRLNEQLINPLKGLGASQLEGGRPDLAGTTFRRAVHITHVNEGPHNLLQIDMLESLAEADLRLGDVEEARNVQDTIFALNQHAYANNSLDIIPPLMRRADWQHRAGLINDQRTTLRQVIRIIEVEVGKEDLRLVLPLTELGQSFFYVDISGLGTYQGASVTTGELYLKRAVRITNENPSADWIQMADASLALGDYYIIRGNDQRAHKVYKRTWGLLSEDDVRLDYRRVQLEQLVALRERPIPRYVQSSNDITNSDSEERFFQGIITVTYDVSVRGRATNLKIIEATPPDFPNMQRSVQREVRTRVYRPQFVESEPINSSGQILVHKFYYRQSDLDAVRTTSELTEQDQT